MHDAARRFCELAAGRLRKPRRVVEVGSRNVNGGVRYLFPGAAYVGVDCRPGPGVDIVADGATWRAARPFDVVLCTETLEHVPDPVALCRNLVALCRPGGVILLTCAADGRAPHSAEDGGPLREGEPYRNVSAADLTEWLAECRVLALDARTPGDLYCVAVR